jgi:hypothetical protein
LLCEICEQELPTPGSLLPGQISTATPRRARAALIDPWGRPHHVPNGTLIGRAGDGVTLQILEASISRTHASLHEQTDGTWMVHDLGSQNGTFVNDQPVNELAVRHGDRVGVGHVDFFFVLGAEGFPEVKGDPLVKTAVSPRRVARSASPAVDDSGGPRTLDIRVVTPSGGGGGILEIDGIELKLTAIQLELILLLAGRMIDETDNPWQVRGFVRSSELLGQLPWDTHNPDDNHVKQLIRRVRRSLIRSGIGDLFESRHRFGYRFRVLPRMRHG